MLTLEEVKETLPKHLKSVVTQALVDKVNNIAADPEMAEHIRQSFVSYTSVLQEGKFKTEDYLSAVAYVSYKVMGYTNQESYKRTFPKRYTDMVARGMDDKVISSYVAAYNKNKLVNLILEQTLVPTWVLNQDLYQKAINVQAELMLGAQSEKVRTEAANSLLTHLKKPETKQVELNIGVKEPEGLNELRDMMTSMAQRQQDLIGQGVTTREIAHQKFGQTIDVTPVEDAEVIAPISSLVPDQSEAKHSNGNSFPLTSFVPDVE